MYVVVVAVVLAVQEKGVSVVDKGSAGAGALAAAVAAEDGDEDEEEVRAIMDSCSRVGRLSGQPPSLPRALTCHNH